jgi:hypothetical protein
LPVLLLCLLPTQLYNLGKGIKSFVAFAAEVIKYDEDVDLALLKINYSDPNLSGIKIKGSSSETITNVLIKGNLIDLNRDTYIAEAYSIYIEGISGCIVSENMIENGCLNIYIQYCSFFNILSNILYNYINNNLSKIVNNYDCDYFNFTTK